MGTYGYYTGSMDIPEERKEEFFRQVVKLTNYGGMMDYERVSLYGYDMALLKPVEICREGRVYFDYNYFEDDIWETAGYDSNKTCFYSGKIGNFEFCDVVTAIHFLYEVNDDDAGVTEVNDCVINADKFVGWINHLLGTAYSLKKRFRLWDCVEKYALSEEASERTLTAYKVMEFIPYSMWRYRRVGICRSVVYNKGDGEPGRAGFQSGFLSCRCISVQKSSHEVFGGKYRRCHGTDSGTSPKEQGRAGADGRCGTGGACAVLAVSSGAGDRLSDSRDQAAGLLEIMERNA